MSLKLKNKYGIPKVSTIDSLNDKPLSEIKAEKSSTSDQIIDLLESSSLYTKEEKDYLLELYKKPVLFNQELANSINAKFVNHALVPDSQGNVTLKSSRQNKASNNHVKTTISVPSWVPEEKITDWIGFERIRSFCDENDFSLDFSIQFEKN